MTSDYGATNGQKEQLSGYFDVNNESVDIKKGAGAGFFGPWTKKKKIAAIVGTVFVILLIIIIIIAATAGHKHKGRNRGVISSLKSGKECAGDKDKQSQCATGECIQNRFVCDGYSDCPAGDDEVKSRCDEHKKQPPCSATQFQCVVSRRCIAKQERCDGAYDCGGDDTGDYSDERNCFLIDTDTSAVSVIKHGEVYPMSPVVDDRVADLICQELGFQAVQYLLPDEQYNNRRPTGDDPSKTLTCGLVSADFDPDGPVLSQEDELINNINLIAQCSDRALTMTCSFDYCGIFGNYTGPSVPTSWTSASMADELAKSTRPFPWVVDIMKGKDLKCRGTIVNAEWVLTSNNCIPDGIFNDRGRRNTWRAIAASDTDFPQERMITKVMRNHFEEMQQRQFKDGIVAVQVFPAFQLNGYAHQACLAQPALLPHFNCFTCGSAKGESEPLQHVRVVPEEDEKCGEESVRAGTFCVNYPHVGHPDSCLESVGSPISCLDPATNSWTLSGVSLSKMGCGQDERLTASMADEYNFYWTDVIVSEPRILGQACDNAEFGQMRFMRGSREGEIYVDILGHGEFRSWHTVYNLTSGLELILDQLNEATISKTVRIANNTGITSKRVAILNCPEDAESLCVCKVHYKNYTVLMGEANSIHFIDDENQNGKLDPEDFEYDNWDNEAVEDLYEDYSDYTSGDRLTVQEIFPTVCSSNNKARQCNNETAACIMIDFICDGTPDCENGEDEDRETCEKFFGHMCPPKWFRCATTYDCIPYANRCDGKGDCLDNSDERECVTVADNGVVYVEQEGLPLPLAGLPSAVPNNTEIDLAMTLCESMGFGAHKELDTYTSDAKGIDFTQGCYKLRTEKYGDTYIVHTDFSKHSSEECNTTFTLECYPPRCGITKENTGPEGPPSWPKLKDSDITPNVDNGYPWSVHIRKGDTYVCGATIVLPDWIVTTYDCVSEISSDLTVQFIDGEGNQSERSITSKASFFTTRRSRRTGEPTERNVVMLSVNPPFELNAISHPLCLRDPLYVPQSLCYVIGHTTDASDTQMHTLRVVPRVPPVCEGAGVKLSEAEADHQCVEYVQLDIPDNCVRARGSALQCLDALRNQWTFTAIMTEDIGRACTDRENSTFAAATITRPLVPWIFDMVDDVPRLMNITCVEEGQDPQVQELIFRKSNYENEWYIVTSEGNAVEWDTEESLQLVAEPLKDLLGAFKVTETRKSHNITALNRVSISCPTDIDTCTCTLDDSATEQGVQKFYMLGTDEQKEEERDKEYQDEDGIVETNGLGDYDYTTPFEFVTPQG